MSTLKQPSSTPQALLLFLILTICAALTLGLTWLPCHASLCTETLFPAATRYHIATYYGLLASILLALGLRAWSPVCRRVSSIHLGRREIPVFKKRISVGAVLLVFWILAVTLVTTIFWINPEVNFWEAKAAPFGWDSGHVQLVVTGIVGHHIDFILGLLLLPVGRNSLLVRVFGLSYGTLLYAHKLLAYILIFGTLVHGLAYCSFWASYEAQPQGSPRREAFEVNNPTITIAESQARGPWSRAVLGTGLVSLILMVGILVTSLPALRRRAYNMFYYVHVIFGSIVFIAVCCHATTNFYFLLPGLLLWTNDLRWRFFGGDTGVSKEATATLASAGGEWYRIVIPNTQSVSETSLEKLSTAQPLQTYYINIPSISRLENHPFTAAKISSNGSDTVLLFQKTPAAVIKRSSTAQAKEWTWKLSRLIEGEMSWKERHEMKVRLEGPYSPPTVAYEHADRVVCIVGGTGLTGACSLARWWFEHRRSEQSAYFTLVWTARLRSAFELQEWQELTRICAAASNMSLQAHCTSEDGRLDISAFLKETFSAPLSEKGVSLDPSAWVYSSGPSGLLTSAADACEDLAAELRAARKEGGRASEFAVGCLEHYSADWEV
ncbi:hypothetical protein LTR62_003477 [Meristemomyces frigidus]|uniref:Ferric oxidoreductase domain-containing protein n=1 Tax=Meristemomyces frigidus TaxID=1508187 RepID=A0AAN7TPD0_9PEZI|nr:hypothetical protein LTR62_003477 [Meristemomyces frigidus]